VAWAGAFIGVFAWSAFHPLNPLVWFLETAPAVATASVLWATRTRWPLTPLAYALLLWLCLLILVGAHYTFEHAPPFDWLKHILGIRRNYFDKFAHFFQGFTPAVVIREIFLRCKAIGARVWLTPLVLSACLAISAAYELVEWCAGVILGGAARAFIAAQGDPWDTQSDMAMALLGASCALLFLSRIHDRQLRSLL
jgi:putative membrane protein